MTSVLNVIDISNNYVQLSHKDDEYIELFIRIKSIHFL